MNKPVYELFYKNGSLNISDLVDTRETVITRQLCTTEFKSAIDKASIVVRYSPEKATLRQNILDYLYGSMETLEDITLKITLDEYSLFTGNLDLSELKLSSKRLPESINLEAKDVSAKLLDRKVDDYIIYEKKSISQIVIALITHAGGTFLNNNIKEVDDRIIPVFAIDREDDDGTYREYIDTLLFEAGGYVLDTDENGKMSIIALPWESYEPTATVDDYLLDKGVVTTRKIFDKTGLKLTWSTLSETGKDQRVWSGDFSRNIQDGKPVGIDIPSGTYYPQNGDIEPTYQPFSADFLDREYLTHQRRDKNKDLSIIAVRDVTAQIVALDSNGKRLDNKKVWDFPILPSLGMAANPTIYAKKAWYLLKNKYSSTVNLQFFTLEGRVLYRSKINHLTVPATAQKLEEYTSQYIFSDEHAKRFSQFYWHYLKYSSTIHKWSVLGDVSLGDVVKVLHKGASAAQASIIVSESLHFIGNTSKVDCVAVALGKYNEYPVKAWTDSGNVTPPVPVPEAPKHLTVDVFPSAVSYYADNYPVDENTKIKVTVNAENIKESINVSWNGGGTVLPVSGGVFEIPVSSLTKVDVLSVSATANGITSSASVAKSFRTGKVNLHSSRNLFEFYADNIPHDEQDLITVECLATGFKNIPSVYLDGVAMQMNPDRTYTIPVSAIKNKDLLKVEAKIAGFYDFLTIQKIKDIPTLNMTLSGTQFFYTADNVPHDIAAQIHVAVKTSGIFEKPVLKIDGVVEPLSSDQTCIIPTGRMEGELKLNLEATCFTLSRTAEINKIIDVPTVGLSLTSDHFTYYADNVVREGQPDIVATATSTGIARGLKLTVNGNEFALNDAGQALIPSTVLDGNVEFVDVKVEPRHIVTISDVRRIRKDYMTPSLTLLTDAGQFAFDINGMPSPEVIHLEYRTEGLSPAIVPSVKVQNQPRQWTGKSIDVSYLEIVSLNLIRVIAEIERFNLKREIVINKVNDSKAIIPIIEYAYGSSITEPPEAEWLGYEDHALAYGDMQLIYDAGWTPMRPELVPENKPYLWMRISVDNRETYSYSPLTGPKGDNGKDGMQNVYCGAKTVHPVLRPDGTPLIPGDYYLDIRDTTAPVPYILQENGVWRLVSATDPEWSAIASVTREDVLALGSVLKTTSAYYAFFAMLSANNGYIDNLGAQSIVMKNGGSIKSENYETSDGIEGWSITSEGDADFNNGTWRGSIANGLVFRPPTHCEINKNMTQQEAYKLLKKAGIGKGVFNSTGVVRNKYQDSFYYYDDPKPLNVCTGYVPFSCLDYETDKVSCNIPLKLAGRFKEFHYKETPEITKKAYAYETPFGYCSLIMPLTFYSYVMAIVKPVEVSNPDSTCDYEFDGYYLLNKTAIENIMNDRIVDPNPPEDPNNSSWRAKYVAEELTQVYKENKRNYFAYMRAMYGVFRIPYFSDSTICSFSDRMHFFVYPIVTESEGLILGDYYNGEGFVGGIMADLNSEPKSENDLKRFACEYPGYHDTAMTSVAYLSSVSVEHNIISMGVGGKTDGGGHNAAIFKADIINDLTPIEGDRLYFLNFHKTIDIPKTLQILSCIECGNRLFGYIMESSVDFVQKISFSEIYADGTRRIIPNESVIWDYKNPNTKDTYENSSISNLFYKDGVIYGAICGSAFRYDLAADKFTDMSMDIATVVQVEMQDSPDTGNVDENNGRENFTTGVYIAPICSGSEIIKTTAMISNICWDNKEQSIMYNYKIPFHKRLHKEAVLTDKYDNDSWICVPVFYNPATDKFKLFAIATNQYNDMALRYGRFSCISDATRRVFVSDSCVIFNSGIHLRNDVHAQDNFPISEVERLDGILAKPPVSTISGLSPSLVTVLDDFTLGPMATLYMQAYWGRFPGYYYSFRLFDKGENSLAFMINTEHFESGGIFPFFSRRIIIRETKDEIHLIVPIVINSTRIPYDPDFDYSNFQSEFSTSTTSKAWDGFLTGEAIEPFLIINKNSTDPVGASFVWDFPAQLTTVEEIDTVMDMISSALELHGGQFLRRGDYAFIKKIAEDVCNELLSKK